MPRFNRKGVTQIKFLPSVASDSLLPTRSEISAGTELTQHISAIDGFSIQNQPIETPDMASTFVAKISGDDSAEDSSLTLYEDSVADDHETDLAKGTTGYIAIFSKGDTPANKGMDVFPVTVASLTKTYTTDNEAAMLTAQFVITGRPLLNATVPAAGTNEVQTITVTGSPTGGTYTLTFSGQTTSAIAYNATAGQVEIALEALSNVDAADVTCAGGPHPGTAITVTFGGQYAGEDVPQMTAEDENLTGGTTPAVAVTTTTPGG